MRKWIAVLLLTAANASAQCEWNRLVVRALANGYIMGQQNRSIAELEDAMVLLADGADELTSNQVAWAASFERWGCEPCQRVHCDTPVPLPIPWSITSQHPVITVPYIVTTNDPIHNWLNQPNTWPGTYSTSGRVTNAVNVEKEN